MTAAICWVLSALKVVERAIPLISVTVVLAGSVAIMEHQLYLGATAEQRAKDLETKLDVSDKIERPFILIGRS